MVDSTNPRVMADNIKMLAAGSGGSAVEANPEGAATQTLTKLGIDDTVYAIPDPVIYSTSERVVGKWIDGSDLYEKTWDFEEDLQISYSAWTSLGIELNAALITDTKVVASSGSYQGSILVYNDSGTWKGQSTRNGDASYVRYLTLQYKKSN